MYALVFLCHAYTLINILNYWLCFEFICTIDLHCCPKHTHKHYKYISQTHQYWNKIFTSKSILKQRSFTKSTSCLRLKQMNQNASLFKENKYWRVNTFLWVAGMQCTKMKISCKYNMTFSHRKLCLTLLILQAISQTDSDLRWNGTELILCFVYCQNKIRLDFKPLNVHFYCYVHNFNIKIDLTKHIFLNNYSSGISQGLPLQSRIFKNLKY